MKTLERLSIAWRYWLTRHGRAFADRSALESWQERQVRSHLERVREASPFYRRLWGEREIAEWRTFPMTDKAMMMANFDELNTAGVRREEAFELALRSEQSRDFSPMLGDVTIGLSSGTSGHRGLFLVSRKERLAWAGAVLAKVLPGSLFGVHRIAFFLRANSNLYGTVGSRRLQFEFYDLLDPLDSHLERLATQQPTLLVAPPSMLRLLAEAKTIGRAAIAPSKIVSVAEVLDPLDRRFISEAFAQPVHQVYQCTEGFLGATCSHGTLHLNEELVCIQKEYVESGRNTFIPIITDFSRLTQPIVRYRLNDLLTERTQPCPCGSPFTAIDAIEGRSDDLFYLPARDGSEPIPVFPDFLSRAVLAATERIEEYRLVLTDGMRLSVSLKVAPEARERACEAVARQLDRLWERVGCTPPEMLFTEYEPPVPGRKLRRIENRSS